MIALKIFAVCCVIVLCFLPAIAAIADACENDPGKPARTRKIWAFLKYIGITGVAITIIPACLLLIGILSNDPEEKTTSLTLVGMGYAFLILSSFNNRIIIPWVNKTVLCSVVIMALTGYLLSFTSFSYTFRSGRSYTLPLFFPLVTYIYIMITRQLIKAFTHVYPLTLDKTFKIGEFSRLYKRKATGWDMAWTLWNIFAFLAVILLTFMVAK